MDIINRRIVLNLNASWVPIGVRSVAEAFVAMNGGDKDNPPVKALDIVYEKDEDGNYNFDKQPIFNPVTWLEWISLPIREYDLVINCPSFKVRVPTCIISLNYRDIPKRRLRPTKSVLYKLQGGLCGYTKEPLAPNGSNSNLEHVIPKSFSGKNTFENLLLVKKEINAKRGNKSLEEVGLSRKFRHKQPAPLPVNYSIQPVNLDCKWFLNL